MEHMESKMQDHINAKTAQFDDMRRRLAEVIHNSWSIEPFDPELHTEDWATADAVIAAFPEIK